MAQLFANDTMPTTPLPEGDLYLKNKWGRSGRYWFFLPELDLSIGTSPKAGCQTLKNHLTENNLNYYSGWPQASRHVWIVRDPVARFWSLWKNKCRDGGKIARGTSDPFFSVGWSVDELLDAIEAGRWNHHWATQSEYEGGHATELVPLENYWEWAEREGLEPGRILNSSHGEVDLTDEQLARVKAIYAKDIELYERGVREYNERVQRAATEGA